MVRSRHRANDAGAVRIVLARDALGGRSQYRRLPSSQIRRLVSQTRTDLQRCHRRRSKAILERAEFINVSASPDRVKIPTALMERLTETLCYAA